MKKSLKKIMASALAVATMAVSVVGMNANAYWHSINVGEGTGYLSVDSSSVYATTTKPSHISVMSVDIIYCYGSISLVTSGNISANKCYIRYTGSNITQAESKHVVGSATDYIVMYA